jgi:hypothetical protein
MGKSRPSLAVAAAAVLAAFALTACGGDDGGSEDEDQITAAIDRVATSGDPKACTDVETQRFIEQTSGGGAKGAAAVKQCEQAGAEGAVADKIDVTNIEVDGDHATAEGAVTGNLFDGQTLDLALVKEGDQWKLDEFKGFAEFNRDALINTIKQQLSSDPSATPQAVSCVTDHLEMQSDENLQALYSGSESSVEDEIFGACGKYFQG